MIITLIAPPAAGKGAISNLIYEKYNLPHISIGDLLRNVEDEKIKKQLEEGAFVDNKIVSKLLKMRTSKQDCKRGFVLDGFPRNLTQIDIYEEICREYNKKSIIIVLDIDKKIGEKRITGRRVCPNCSSVYNINIKENMPQKEDSCDKCQTKLIHRTDDSLETYNHRYEIYEKETKPIIDYYSDKINLYHIDGTKSLKEVFNDIDRVIKENIW